MSLLAMRGQPIPQLRDREWLNCVLLSPVILEELQEHSPYQPPHEMAQQVVHITHTMCTYFFHNTSTTCTVAGSDYVAFAEELAFSHGDTRVCYIMDIIQDDICESDPNESIFFDLAYVRGVQPIVISPATAQVIFDDRRELECGEYMCGPFCQSDSR